jgi:hypothetical protein
LRRSGEPKGAWAANVNGAGQRGDAGVSQYLMSSVAPITDNLSKAGWSLGCVSAIDSNRRTIFVADAHRDDGQRLIEPADEKLTAFMELESAIRVQKRTDSHFICQLIVNGFGTLGTSTAVPFLHAERAVDSKKGGFARASRFP